MAINNYFSEHTEQTIQQRMLDNIRDDVDKRQGSISYDLTAPAAIELADVYIRLNQMLGYAFINEDTPSELITLHAEMFGLQRKEAIQASDFVQFKGENGLIIPAGTQIRTDDGVYFTTVNRSEIADGTADVLVVADIKGTIGNVGIGEITTVAGDLAGVLSVTNLTAFNNGVAEETDEALLKRVYDQVRKPATSGNIYDYEKWAKEVSGISDAKVYPIWNGAGTVKVVLLDDEKTSPTPELVQEVAAHIESVRPIGSTVTVLGAEEIGINVNVSIVLAEGSTVESAKNEFKQALSQYLSSLAFKEGIVRYTRIASMLLDTPSIVDYSDLVINSRSSNIEVSDGSVAVVGEVTLIEL